jgi:hypothetical protein
MQPGATASTTRSTNASRTILVDSFDEELELEVDDRVIDARAPQAQPAERAKADRRCRGIYTRRRC